MKWIFLGIFVVLSACSYWIYATLPEQESGKPVIYWVTDPNPARKQQVELFQKWLAEHHPDVDVKLLLDMGNNDPQKKIIQGVSGVGGDIQDAFSGAEIRRFRSMGIVENITDQAEALGFGLDQTYPALDTEITITVDGEVQQLAFPCNVATRRIVVNDGLLRVLDFPPPPKRWTVESFERYGQAYVRMANRGKTNRRRFLVREMPVEMLFRSAGVDLFNETLTGAGIDDYALTPNGPAKTRGYVDALKKLYQWTYVDRILPTQGEIAALNTEGGYGGANIASFERGDFLMSVSGRWELIKMRETNRLRVNRLNAKLDSLAAQGWPELREIYGQHGMVALLDHIDELEATGTDLPDDLRPDPLTDGPFLLSSTEYPYWYFRNADIRTRAAIIYTGSKHKDLAALFLSFLASEEYNANIVADADGLPPNPAYTQSDAYLRPAKDPEAGIYPETEWNLHEAWLEDTQTICIGASYSPYILYSEADRQATRTRDRFLQDLADVNSATDLASARIDRIIAENVEKLKPDDPLRAKFRDGMAMQKKIDACKRAGRKIPAEWISNPFFLRYYRAIGMLEEQTETNPKPAEVAPDATVPGSGPVDDGGAPRNLAEQAAEESAAATTAPAVPAVTEGAE